MTMEARASRARFDGLVRRADVKELTRSRDAATAKADATRVQKNKANAAKRKAERVVAEEKEAAAAEKVEASRQRELRQVAPQAAEAECESRVRAEKELEKERREVERLTDKLSLLAVEKSELDMKYRQAVKDAGLHELEAPAAAAATRVMTLQQQVLRDTMAADQDQRRRQLASMAKLVTANANLRRQGNRQRERITVLRESEAKSA
ncbi:unnamed protein product, partial [Ectocarpus sp. 12 AP-2014]